MAKRRRDDQAGGVDGFDRVFAVLDEAAPGLHDIDPPSAELPAGLPGPLVELYARCDGARLFLETIELDAAADVALNSSGRWQFGSIEGDALAIDHRGRIWREDPSIEDEVCDGTRLDRWLAGVVDATALLYDRDGEFADGAFDDEGEVVAEVRERGLRAQIKRDPSAPGPRWRLALALLDEGAIENARDELEQVVADDPALPWAWLDLGRISERMGELGNAIDEARMAAQTAEGVQHPQAGYFWAQLARLATRAGDDMLRAEAATKTSLLAPSLKQEQLSGARESLEAGDTVSAKGLLELLRAVWPRDLEVLALSRRIENKA
ncbi:MAG: hypothetical protein AB7P03_25560 [Kofleriaceae bacterium]